MKEDEEQENASEEVEEEEDTNGENLEERGVSCMQNVCRSSDRRRRRRRRMRALYIDTLIVGHLHHTNGVNSSRIVKHTHTLTH